MFQVHLLDFYLMSILHSGHGVEFHSTGTQANVELTGTRKCEWDCPNASATCVYFKFLHGANTERVAFNLTVNEQPFLNLAILRSR